MSIVVAIIPSIQGSIHSIVTPIVLSYCISIKYLSVVLSIILIICLSLYPIIHPSVIICIVLLFCRPFYRSIYQSFVRCIDLRISVVSGVCKFLCLSSAVPGDGLLCRRWPLDSSQQVWGPFTRGDGPILPGRDGSGDRFCTSVALCSQVRPFHSQIWAGFAGRSLSFFVSTAQHCEICMEIISMCCSVGMWILLGTQEVTKLFGFQQSQRKFLYCLCLPSCYCVIYTRSTVPGITLGGAQPLRCGSSGIDLFWSY